MSKLELWRAPKTSARWYGLPGSATDLRGQPGDPGLRTAVSPLRFRHHGRRTKRGCRQRPSHAPDVPGDRPDRGLSGAPGLHQSHASLVDAGSDSSRRPLRGGDPGRRSGGCHSGCGPPAQVARVPHCARRPRADRAVSAANPFRRFHQAGLSRALATRASRSRSRDSKAAALACSRKSWRARPNSAGAASWVANCFKATTCASRKCCPDAASHRTGSPCSRCSLSARIWRVRRTSSRASSKGTRL